MKKFLSLTLSVLFLILMVGCNNSETNKDSNDLTNQTRTETVQLETIKKDINFSNNMPINLCYDGYIIYLSNEGNGYQGIYTYDGKEILPIGDYSISPFLNSYVKVYGNTAIDNIYPVGIYNVKTGTWLFEQSVELNNGTINIGKHNNYLEIVIGSSTEYYNEDGEKVDSTIVENASNSQETPNYLNANWEVDPSNNKYFAVVNAKHGKMTDYTFRNVRSFDGGFYKGIAFYTDEIKPDVDRQGIISSIGDILVEPQYSQIYVANNYVLGIKNSTTSDLYKIVYN